MKDKYLVYQFDLKGLTGLHWSVKNNDIQMTSLLLNFKSDFSHKDTYGRTPLMIAIKNHNVDMVRLLIFNPALTKSKS
jgi:ankyrin repeat protein